MSGEGARSWLVAYDVRDASRLRRMGRLMGAAGHRLQWSVYACDLDGRALADLRAAIAATARAGEDDVRMYALGRDTAGAWLGPLPQGESVDLFGYPCVDLVRRWRAAPWGSTSREQKRNR